MIKQGYTKAQEARRSKGNKGKEVNSTLFFDRMYKSIKDLPL